jgi:hypothetical protein
MDASGPIHLKYLFILKTFYMVIVSRDAIQDSKGSVKYVDQTY